MRVRIKSIFSFFFEHLEYDSQIVRTFDIAMFKEVFQIYIWGVAIALINLFLERTI